MNFSLIFNTRGRSEILEGCLLSFAERSTRKSGFDFLIKVDDDDLNSIKECNSLKQKYPFFDYIVSPRPISLNESVSKLAFLSKGDIVYGINDDIYMLTDGWDQILLDKIGKFKKSRELSDNIFYLRTECNSVDRDFSLEYAGCPVISKEAVLFFDLYLPESYVGLNADRDIFKVYEGINRVIDCREVKVNHLYHNTLFKVMSPDLTSYEMRQNTYNNIHKQSEFDIEKYINKFKEIYG